MTDYHSAVLEVRELMNGAWFVIASFMWLALVIYMVVGYKRRGWPRGGQLKFRLLRARTWWLGDPGLQLAASLLIFTTGSTIRGGYIWALLTAEAYPSIWVADLIERAFPVLLVSTGLTIVGGMCAVRVLTPTWMQPWNWLIPGITAVAVPLLVYYA